MERAIGGLICSLLIWGVVAGDTCPEGEPITYFDVDHGSNPSVFDDLTGEEIRDVNDYIKDNFAVKEGDQITLDSTYVFLIERLPSPKADVLAFLHNGGKKPKRYAKVILYRGDLTPPIIEEYSVGPLPNIREHKRLKIGGQDSVDYIKRQYFSPADYPSWTAVTDRELAKVDHIVKKVTGGYSKNNCSDKCLYWLPGMPGKFVSGDYSMWIFLMRTHESLYLHPIGLQFHVQTSKSLDISDWVVDFVWFRGETFLNFEEMLRDYVVPNSPDPPIKNLNSKNLYSSLNQRGDPLPKKNQRGPMSFMPDGRRYSVEGHHVEWQGWRFDFNMRSSIGLQVHDVRFKNERVAYELSISEVGIAYAGASPTPSHSVFIDSPFSFGLLTYELVEGIDCPSHATYFDSAHFFNFNPFIIKNAICVFEHNRGVPIRHHYESDGHGSYKFIQGMPGNVLVLRSVITVYNYEYILDYIFHQNGAVEVSVSLTGYILSSFYTGEPADDRFGFEIFPNGLGQIHNHMLQLKADVDIGQTNNRFQTLDIKVKQIVDPGDPSNTIYQQYFEKNLRRTEKNATYKFNFDTPKYLVFFNNDAENAYGNKKGYRLYPVGINKNVMPEVWPLMKGMSWTKYQVAVTKQKDVEDRGSSIYNLVDMLNPVVSFQSFIDDDENIVDKDLVAWISLGAFHIPHSEDIPIVQTPSLTLTYFLRPYNYFDEDPSLASRDNIRVTPNKDGSQNPEFVGVSPEVTCSPKISALKSSGEMMAANICVLLISSFSLLLAFK